MEKNMENIKIGNLITATDTLKIEDFTMKYTTNFFFEKEVIDLMLEAQCRNMYVTMHPSNLTENPFSFSSPLIDLSKKEKTYATIANLDYTVFMKNNARKLYDNNNSVSFEIIPNFISGNYLIIFAFFNSEEVEPRRIASKAQEYAVNSANTINAIRFFYGLAAVGPSVFECCYDEATKTSTTISPFTMFKEDGKVSNDLSSYINFYDRHTINIESPLLNKDANLLFERAVKEQRYDSRFLFSWLTFECVVGGGDKRKSLFNDKLNSEVANEEVYRLFNKRNELAHEGKSKITAADCTSILWAIRIAVCPEQAAQKAICLEYEEWILHQR